MKTGLMNRKFRYYKADETDVARTFVRIRKQMKTDAEAAKPAETKNVAPIKQRRSA